MAWRKPRNVHEWLGIVLAHKKKLFFPAITVMIVVVVHSLWWQRTYRASALFERTKHVALQQMGRSPIDNPLQEIRKDVPQDIKGRAAIEQLIRDLGLTRDLPIDEDGELTNEGRQAMNEMTHEFRSKIHIAPDDRSLSRAMYRVSFQHPDRELVHEVVNTLVDNYIRKARNKLDERLRSSKNFFQEQVDRSTERLRKQKEAKETFERDRPEFSPNDPNSVTDRKIDKQNEYEELTKQLQINEDKRLTLEQWMNNMDPFIESSRTGQNPELAALLDKKKTIESELESHLYGMGRTEEHPSVRRARQRLKEIDQQIQETEREVVVGKDIEPNIKRYEMESQLAVLTAEIRSQKRLKEDLKDEIEKLESLDRNLFALRNQYKAIEKDLKDAEKDVKYWDQRLKDLTVALEAEVAQRGVQLRVVEHAEEEYQPSSPSPTRILMAAFGAGGAFALMIVFIAELLDNSFRSIEQAVDDLKLPVLGAVNEIVSHGEIMRRKVLGLGVFPALAGVMSLLLVIGVTLAMMSLKKPSKYEQLIENPRAYLQSMF